MLLEYTTYTNVLGYLDFMDKLHGWSLTHGWETADYLSGYWWNIHHWDADPNGMYYTLTKSGYGTQNLICSIISAKNTTGESAWGVYHSMRSQVSYSATSTSASQMNPVDQNCLCGPGRTMAYSLHYSPASAYGLFALTYDSIIPKVWFFAGPHWICAMVQMNSVFCQAMHFGSFEMFEDNPSQGQCCGAQSTSGNTGSPGYYDIFNWTLYVKGTTHADPFGASFKSGYSYYGWAGCDFYYNDRGQWGPYHAGDGTQSATVKDNCRCDLIANTASSTTADPLLGVGGALKANHYSDKRPLIKPIFYMRRPGDLLWQPVCKAPIWKTRFSGLEIGQQLDFGDESYLVFPTRTVNSIHGYAFRIA